MTDMIAAFQTARLKLVPLRAADAAELRTLTDDPEIIEAVDFLASPFDEDDALALIEGNGDGRDLFVGAYKTGKAELIGVVGLHLRDEMDLEIGYWFAATARGLGFGSEAVRGVMEAAVRRCPARRVVAECREANAASRQLLEGLGFAMTTEPGKRPGRRLFVWTRSPARRPDRT